MICPTILILVCLYFFVERLFVFKVVQRMVDQYSQETFFSTLLLLLIFDNIHVYIIFHNLSFCLCFGVTTTTIV